MTTTDVLAHYGIKGMRWGVRRRTDDPGSSSDTERALAIRDKVRRGGTKSLTNEEMQALVSRINLEQQYARLNPSKIEKGAKLAGSVLRLGSTVNQVMAFINSPAGKALVAALRAAKR